MTTTDPYEMWDASYVLGALSSSQRRAYEAHLGGCNRCRAGVSDLSGMPALLTLLDRDEMSAPAWDDSDGPPEQPQLHPELLDGLLHTVAARRRRFRWVTGAVAAVAATVLAVGVLLAVRPGVDNPVAPQASVGTMTMAPVLPSELTATFTLTGHDWGTTIDMSCSYPSSGSDDGHGDEGGDELALVAVGRDGSRAELGSWLAQAGSTAVTSGSTSMPIGEIATVQVISAETGHVLLQRNL